MSINALPDGPPSQYARHLFCHLARSGGTLRLRQLLRWCAVPREELVDALNDLLDRTWIKVTFRPPRDRLNRPLADIHRITTTRYGRMRYKYTWYTR